jgi:hypothetical protein
MLETLRADFHRIPDLIALGAPEQPQPLDSLPELDPEPVPEPEEQPASALPEPAPQLGLF